VHGPAGIRFPTISRLRLSRPAGKCRRTHERQDTEREPLAAHHSDESRIGCHSSERQPPGGPVSPAHAPLGAQESRCGGRAYDLSHHLSSAQGPRLVYGNLGARYLEQRDRKHATRRHIKQLKRLGYRVKLEPVALETAGAFSKQVHDCTCPNGTKCSGKVLKSNNWHPYRNHPVNRPSSTSHSSP
jgi:hypothetical protein